MQDFEIVARVQEAKAIGQSKEVVYLELLSSGVSVESIESAYKTAEAQKDKADYQKRTISIVVIIGAVLVGAGIFSFIASNWEEMSKTSKILTIFFFLLSTHTAGWMMQEKYLSPKTGQALIFLGLLIFGGGIFLIGQIFHISTNWPDAFILWMMGSIVLALAVESHFLLVFSALLGMIAVINHFALLPDNFSGFLTSTLLIVVATITTLFVAILEKRKIPEKYNQIY